MMGWMGLRRLKNLLVLLLGFAYVDLILLGHHLPSHWSLVTNGPWPPLPPKSNNGVGNTPTQTQRRRRNSKDNERDDLKQEQEHEQEQRQSVAAAISPLGQLPSSSSSSSSTSFSTMLFTNFQSGVAQWENSTVLPAWLKEYVKWHQGQRSQMNERNWSNYRFAIMQCSKRDDCCGGTADRLKPFLLALLVAHQTQRLLFIKWEVPKQLEDFLLPPLHGIDWRLPDYVKPTSGRFAMSSIKHITRFLELYNYSIPRMNQYSRPIFFRFQSFDGGAAYYDEQAPNGLPFLQVYRAAWNVMFTPIADISIRIQRSLQEMNLIPGHYTAAHVRAWYKVETRTKAFLRDLAQNALNCASQLEGRQPHYISIRAANDHSGRNSTPPQRVFYVASDSGYVVERAMEYGPQRAANVRVVARTHQAPPLHLEKADHPELRSPSEYYDIFVDLYIMALSQCVTYNKGGFGQLAHLLSYNVSCYSLHHYNKIMRCNWTDSVNVVESTDGEQYPSLSRPVFASPMPDLRPLHERQPNQQQLEAAIEELDPEDPRPLKVRAVTSGKGVPKRNIVGRSQIGELLHTY